MGDPEANVNTTAAPAPTSAPAPEPVENDIEGQPKDWQKATPQQTGNQPQGYEPHNIFGAVFKALGGGDRTEYRVAGPGETDANGKPVAEGTTIASKVAPTKGQLGKSILAAVITGLAAGEQQRGPGANLRALSTGGAAVLQQNAAADKNNRATAQQDYQQQQQAQLKKAQIFASNAAAIHSIREAEKLDDEHLQSMVDRDASSLQDVDPSDVVAKDVPQDQALADMKAGKYGATTHNVYATGVTQVKDKDGNPVIDPMTGQPKREVTLTITNDKNVPLTQQDASRYAQYHLPGFAGLNPSQDTTVPASQKRGWDQMVHSIENARGLAKKMGMTDEQFNQTMQQPGAARAFQDFARYSTGDPYADLAHMESAKDKDSGNPVYGARTLGILRDAFGGDAAKTYHDKIAAQTKAGEIKSEAAAKGETELGRAEIEKTRAEASKANAEASVANSAINGPKGGGEGEEYLKTLPTARANFIRSIGDGRVELSAGLLRSDKLIAQQLSQAYPKFDQSRASSYFATRKDFTSGKTSTGINSYNTSIAHLGTMYDHVNNSNSLMINTPGTEVHRQLELDKQLVSTELAKAVSNGQMTEGEKKEILASIAGATVNSYKERISEAVELLNGKLEAYQTQWENGAPPGAVAPVQILSPKSKATLARIKGEPANSNAQPFNPNSLPDAK